MEICKELRYNFDIVNIQQIVSAELAIEGGGRRLYLLKNFGIKYEDMNELITIIYGL